jgi:hypothetical protein
MKKFLVAILAIVYLGSSIGATTHFHYCMDKLVNWDFGQAKKDKCDKCGTSKCGNHQKNKCCSDEFTALKNGDQRITETVNLIQVFYHALFPQIELQAPNIPPEIIANTASTTLFRSSVAIHILNCVFLI